MFASDESKRNFEALVTALKLEPGSVIIGAGLSTPMKPTWRSLHSELQEESGLDPRRKFKGEVAPIDFEDFRDALGSDRYLGVLRRRFGGIVSAYPDLYARLDEIQGFQQLATTNYDEFLAAVAVSNNRNPDLAVYPDLNHTEARYVYLHGRADTAHVASDLVVCEDDYVCAYGTPGQAQCMLRVLLSRPCVFVGSSMDDLDLQVILRERARIAANPLAELPAQLFAILAEPKPECEQSTRDAVEIETRRLRRFGVQSIFYVRDDEHTRLRSLLLELRHQVGPRALEPLFLERVEELDRLAAVESPTPRQVTEVIVLISTVPELARHFFGRDQLSFEWYVALKDSVIVPSAIEPWEVRNGGREIALWPAAPFVRRLTRDQPDAISGLIETLQATANWHVRSVLGDAASDLPATQLRLVLPILRNWMDDPNNSASYLADRLSYLAEPLSEAGEFDATLELLDVLLSSAPAMDSSTLALHLDEAWFAQLEGALSRLSEARPEETYRLLMARLQAALGEAGIDADARSSTWRRAIENHEQDSKVIDWPLHFLLDSTRDALLIWLDHNLKDAALEVAVLLQSDSVVSRRLALSTLWSHPEMLRQLSAPVLSGELFSREYFHELALLIHQRFAELDEESSALIHAFIGSGPDLDPDAAQERREQDILHFRWRWLHIVPQEHFTLEERAWWESGVQHFGHHPQPFFLVWRSTESPIVYWGKLSESSSNPLRTAWEAGGAPALAVTYRESGGWGSGIERLVHEDPEGLLALVQHIGPDDGERLAAYFDAYDTLLDSGTHSTFDWEPLIYLIERVVEGATEIPQTVTHAARLIREGIINTQIPLPHALLDRSMIAMAKAIEELSQPFDVDPELTLSVDQLNHPAGAAANALMLSLHRKLELEPEPRQIPRVAQPWIDAALAEGWGGVQMRHSLGQFWPTLEWAEPGWLSTHSEQLWPTTAAPRSVNAKRAFLAGFVEEGSTSAVSVQALVRMFSDLIEDLELEEPIYLYRDDVVDAIVQRLAIAWLWELAGFGFEGLLGTFVATAPDNARARLVWHLGRMHRFNADNPLDLEATRARQDEYWQCRVDDLGSRLPVAEASKELSTFFGWPMLASWSLSELEERLNVGVDHLAEGSYVVHLLKLISVHAEREPEPALRLLIRILDRLHVERAIGRWRHSRDLEAALDAIRRGAKAEQHEQILRMADFLVRGGLSEAAERMNAITRNP